jgi:hypothetical protein
LDNQKLNQKREQVFFYLYFTLKTVLQFFLLQSKHIHSVWLGEGLVLQGQQYVLSLSVASSKGAWFFPIFCPFDVRRSESLTVITHLKFQEKIDGYVHY